MQIPPPPWTLFIFLGSRRLGLGMSRVNLAYVRVAANVRERCAYRTSVGAPIAPLYPD